MISVSLCMIVKNEERVLRRCLDSVADLVEELIIVDTGSLDATKEIAASYDKVKLYDFTWVQDFSAARNFAFSKATMDYIYSADADEVLDEENRERFRRMKEALLPEIEIVQMKYGNQLSFGTVYNFDEEYRPKLFKRLRQFVWEEPVHETIRQTPIVFDSDIVITHMPESSHAGRDFGVFLHAVKNGHRLSDRLLDMYARELVIGGEDADFAAAYPVFVQAAADTGRSSEMVMESCLICAMSLRRAADVPGFFKYATKVLALGGCSELCCEYGDYYVSIGDEEEAALWYYNACFETQPVLVLAKSGRETKEKLAECYEKMGLYEVAASYREETE